MLLQANFQRDNTPQILFNVIYGLICTSPIFSGEYTGILIGLAYIQFLTIAKHRKIDWVVQVCITGLVLSICATLLLLIIHWDVILSGEGTASETLKSVGWFGLAFMVVDAVRFQARYYNIDIANFAKCLLVMAICAVPAKLLLFTALFDVPFIDYFQYKDRNVAFLDLNPNYADDVLVAHLVVVAWAIVVLRTYLLENKLLAAAALAIIAFITFHFFGANSRAAFLGVSCSFLILFCISIRHLSVPSIVVLIGAVSIAAFFVPDRLTKRLTETAVQIEFIIQSYGNNNEIRANELAQIADLKEIVLDIYSHTPKEISVAAAIAKECRYRLVDMSGKRDDANLPTSYRYLIYQDAFKIWSIHPYFGYGAYDKKTILAETKNVNPCRTAYFNAVHSHYLDVAIRGGLFALISFAALSLVLFYLLALSLTYRRGNWLMPLPVLAYFPYLYVQNLTGISFHKKADLSAILFTMAVLLSINLMKSRNKIKSRVDFKDGLEIPAKNSRV